MRKTHKEMVTKREIVVDEIVCNKCGQGFIPRYFGLNYYESSFVKEVNLSFGITDGNTYEFDLCEACLNEIIDSFKIYPKVTKIQ